MVKKYEFQAYRLRRKERGSVRREGTVRVAPSLMIKSGTME